MFCEPGKASVAQALRYRYGALNRRHGSCQMVAVAPVATGGALTTTSSAHHEGRGRVCVPVAARPYGGGGASDSLVPCSKQGGKSRAGNCSVWFGGQTASNANAIHGMHTPRAMDTHSNAQQRNCLDAAFTHTGTLGWVSALQPG